MDYALVTEDRTLRLRVSLHELVKVLNSAAGAAIRVFEVPHHALELMPPQFVVVSYVGGLSLLVGSKALPSERHEVIFEYKRTSIRLRAALSGRKEHESEICLALSDFGRTE